MEAVVKKWGNSLGVRIPSAIAKEVDLEDGSPVEIEDRDGKIVISPREKYALKDLLKGITAENRHGEIESAGPLGREAW
jgi:Growth regulator